MENADVAAVLEELADLLEIRGANPFRVRAYRSAARTVESLTRRLTEMVEAGEPLTDLPGIGKEMERHLLELLERGSLRMLEELWEEIPRSVVQLVRLGGLGPRKARQLWDELKVESIEMLEAEILAGRVQALAGFGERSARKLLEAIEAHRSQGRRFPRAEVEPLVEALVAYVARAPGVEAVEVAGSYRRQRETVGDLDLLARSDADGAAAVAHFAAFPGAVRVEAAGDTKGSLVLRSGLQVDLRVVPSDSFGAALHYFTGSKEHNVRVRALGVKRGLRVNEWGVFRSPRGGRPGEGFGERVGGATEEEVFGAVGLPWIPPELREDRGEVEAAREGRLPELVTGADLRGDLQMHSTWSDGRQSVEAMALACRDLGYEYLAMTDHSQALTMTRGLTPERVRSQWDEIDDVRSRLEGVTVLKGLEVDILRDGSLDMPDWVLDGLDIVVVSVHSFMGLGEAAMTERVIQALRHPRVHILAHPTGRRIGRRPPYAIDVEAVLQAAAELGVAVELNASPQRLDLSDVHVHRARGLGLRVAINTDAHSVRGLATMRHGVAQARRGWLERKDVLNAMPLDQLRGWLERRSA